MDAVLDFLDRYPRLPGFTDRLLVSLIFVLVIVVLRRFADRYLLRNIASPEARREASHTNRHISLVLIMGGLLFIWAAQVRGFLLALTAVAVALVVATKELIMCLTGWVMKTVWQAYKIGDRVKIATSQGDIRGDVIDSGLLAMVIMEVGPREESQQRTGRVVMVPHSLLLTQPLVNETWAVDYVMHEFVVPIPEGEGWEDAEARLLRIARDEIQPYQPEAEQQYEQFEEKYAFRTISREPQVFLRLQESSQMQLVLRIPAPSRRQRLIQDRILRRYFAADVPPVKAG